MNGVMVSLVVSFSTLILVACGSFRSDSSPDIIYDDNSQQARELQIPPDLTDVSNSEQFIIPGTNGGPVTRNTLLPEFASIRFERVGNDEGKRQASVPARWMHSWQRKRRAA